MNKSKKKGKCEAFIKIMKEILNSRITCLEYRNYSVQIRS